MHLCIHHVLSADEVTQVTAGLHGGRFVDGRQTAGWIAREVKNNLQLEAHSKSAQAARKVVSDALLRNEQFEMAVRPKQMRPPLLSRYEPGMEYGWHIDDPMMGGPPPLRTDVAFTVFLTDPAAYQGGELIVQSAGREISYKLPAGSLVLYPADTLHRVAPISEGVRLVAVSWVQSFVRDPARRELLLDLDVARRALFEQVGRTPEFNRLNKAFANLVRMWVEL